MLAWRKEERNKQRTVKKSPCTDCELIERLIQVMAAIVLCVLLMLGCCMLVSFYAFLLYAAYVISYQVRNLRG